MLILEGVWTNRIIIENFDTFSTSKGPSAEKIMLAGIASNWPGAEQVPN